MSNTDFPDVAEVPVSGDPYHDDPAVRAAVNPTTAPAPRPRSERDDAGAYPAASAADNLPAFDPSAEPGAVTGLSLADYRRAGQDADAAANRFFHSKLEAGLEAPARGLVRFAMTPGDYMQGKISPEEAQNAAIAGGVGLALGGPGAEADAATLGSGMMRRGRFGRESMYTSDMPTEGPPAAGHNLPTSNQPLSTLPEDQPRSLYDQGVDALKATPLDSHPQEQALNVNSILHPDAPAQPPRSQNVTDIAKGLDARGQAALTDLGVPGGKITGPHEFTDELISRQMAQEANAALSRPGANASDWYTGQVDKAMNLAGKIYPELATDANAKKVFQTALAVTSQGETVSSNTRLALQAYDYYKQNGVFPTDMKAAGFDSLNAPAMQGNFKKYNQLVQELGPDEAHRFLDTDFRAGDLSQMGYGKVGGENVNTMVKGSAIFGAKIGGGFFQNLGGNYDPVTMDLWFMRHWGRQTGTLVGKPDTTNQYIRFSDAMHDPAHAAEMDGRPPPDDEEGTLQLSRDLAAEHERRFAQDPASYKKDPSLKSELTHSAIAYRDGVEGVNQAPTSGGQRQWIRGVVGRSRDILEQEYGRQLTNADLQAVLWYPEKELYSKLGGKPSEDYNTSYADALAEHARAKGIPEDVIQSILRPAPGGSGSATEGAVAGRAAPLRQEGAGAAGQARPGAGTPTPPELTHPLTPGRPQASIEPAYGDPFAGMSYG